MLVNSATSYGLSPANTALSAVVQGKWGNGQDVYVQCTCFDLITSSMLPLPQHVTCRLSDYKQRVPGLKHICSVNGRFHAAGQHQVLISQSPSLHRPRSRSNPHHVHGELCLLHMFS
jgi:hypothetical protein